MPCWTAAKGERLWPYVAVSMLGGIRTEEARALRWSEVDLEAGTVAVYRSVRRTGETKTEKSRRVFQIPEIAVEALRELVLKQAAARAKAGTAWKENNLVFCTSLGGPMYATDVRMEFKRITEKAGLGRDWTPRELRHTFVSLLSDSGVPIEQIADAVGHSSYPDNRGRVPAPAPAGYAYRCHRAGPAVREQRKDRRRPKLSVRLPVRLPRPYRSES